MADRAPSILMNLFPVLWSLTQQERREGDDGWMVWRLTWWWRRGLLPNNKLMVNFIRRDRLPPFPIPATRVSRKWDRESVWVVQLIREIW